MKDDLENVDCKLDTITVPHLKEEKKNESENVVNKNRPLDYVKES